MAKGSHKSFPSDNISQLLCAEPELQRLRFLPPRRRRSHRAVSQVIAALLLIAIAVATAILLYAFSMGLFGSLGAGGGQQVKELLIMEAYDWTELGALKVWVKNVGAANIVLGDLFVNGLTVNYILPGQCDNTISIQQSCRIIINQFALTITLGASYVLKIVAVNGAVFSYSVTAGRTG